MAAVRVLLVALLNIDPQSTSNAVDQLIWHGPQLCWFQTDLVAITHRSSHRTMKASKLSAALFVGHFVS